MQSILKLLFTSVVYPLLKEGATWIYQKYMENKAVNKREDYLKQKRALKKAIKNAKDDDEIKQLSIILHNLSGLN